MANNNWRMGFHLMPAKGSLNDPSGLCQFKGIYHVFCQTNPSWPEAGAKHWGHFSSPDLVHWQLHDSAILPDSADDAHGSYPGCAYVSEDGQTLNVYYTGTVKEPGNYDYIHAGRRSSVIRVRSTDGFTFGKKEVLLTNEDYPSFVTQVVRSPEVWRQDGQFYMLLGARDKNDDGLALIYTSEDGDKWNHQATIRADEHFGYVWENPNRLVLGGRAFLSTSVQGLTHTDLSNQNVYSSGYFWTLGNPDQSHELDDATFTEWDQGFDFYAPQTFEDDLGRTILFGWMGMPGASYANHVDHMTWNSCLTVPREVTFIPDPNGNDRLRQWPVRELEALRGQAHTLTADEPLVLPHHRADILIEGITSRAGSIDLDEDVTFSFGNYRTRMRFAQDSEVGAGRAKRTGVADWGIRNIRILVDDSAVEVFVNDGRQTYTTRWFPTADELTLTTDIEAASITVYEMGDGMSETYKD
jgi:beta-fructofuranosidase